jgi:hypothetical protein
MSEVIYHCAQCQLLKDANHNAGLCDAISKLQAKNIAEFFKLNPGIRPTDPAESTRWAEMVLDWLIDNRPKSAVNMIYDVGSFVAAANAVKTAIVKQHEDEVLHAIAKVTPASPMPVTSDEVPVEAVPPMDFAALITATDPAIPAKAVKAPKTKAAKTE